MAGESDRGAVRWQAGVATTLGTMRHPEIRNVSRSHRSDAQAQALCNWTVIITRPAAAAEAWCRAVAAMGGLPVVLPGLAIRALPDPARIRAELQAAAGDAVWVFTSPAAVEQAAGLLDAWPDTTLVAVGEATAGQLRARGAGPVLTPSGRPDSEGLLDLPCLREAAGQPITVVTGVGGRGLLQRELRGRGAKLREIAVYERVAPSLEACHQQAVRALPQRSILLISSAEAMAHLQGGLPPAQWQRLLACELVVSSPRLRQLALDAGFRRCSCAASALLSDMLVAAQQVALKEGCL